MHAKLCDEIREKNAHSERLCVAYMPKRVSPCRSHAGTAIRVIIQEWCSDDYIWVRDRQKAHQHLVHRI
jgi:hypothetical protein